MTDSVVFQTDSTPPTAYPGSLQTGVAGFTNSDAPLVQYMLYEDSTVWDAWYTWAEGNAYNTDGKTKYSERAIQIKGKWPSLSADTSAEDAYNNASKSFMCMTDATTGAKYGGFCLEAELTDSDNLVHTWRIL